MARITVKDLRNIINRLNIENGTPDPEWNTIGSYQLSGAYGGYSLHKILSEGGAVEDVFRCGHIKAKDLYYRIDAFLTGIETRQAK